MTPKAFLDHGTNVITTNARVHRGVSSGQHSIQHFPVFGPWG